MDFVEAAFEILLAVKEQKEKVADGVSWGSFFLGQIKVRLRKKFPRSLYKQVMCFKITGPSLQGQAQECSDGDCVGDRKAYRVDLFTVRLRLCVCVRMCACVRRGSVLRYRCIPDDNNSLTPGAMATRKRSVCAGG